MNIIKKFLKGVVACLPGSPFTAFIDGLDKIPYMAELNWFIPVKTIVAIGSAWLVAVGLFYLYSIILRWVKAIE